MHASLFLNNDARTAATIVMATTLLGLVCAWSREQTGSLVGPLLAHFAFTSFLAEIDLAHVARRHAWLETWQPSEGAG
jgi:membrane protease YdiL (CAAX protease family)